MKSNKRKRARVERPVIERGEELEAVIFGPVHKALTRRALQSALGPVVRAWLRATCLWDGLAIGDYRFVIFSLDPTPNVNVFVQFWSEPLEPIIWEVSSGRWHRPRDKWLTARRTQQVEASGFAIADGTANYRRQVTIASAADVSRVAREVVNLFYDAFDYRGQQPLNARLVHKGRSVERPVYEGFTPEDVSKLFAASGFRVEEAITDDDEVQEPPMIRCRKRGVFTVVEFDDQVEDENLYRRCRFSADFPMTAEQAAALPPPPGDASTGGDPVLGISVVHGVSGGVTLAWMLERIAEWDAVTAAHRRELRAESRPRTVHASQTVH